ncbi:50S ribosomal protein L9 [Cuneatibacter sp. NSJ-177]|uniref:50S ribosomal protein L9 n=1 Tax=Cuneatibacter sp. NSJ-177 TaxID=2931401 RepID=UPI001FD34F30|nr:50S ribosomal protein L9 [Cuneatibacter sp. NSJ-177]MCJ7834681.1 50S ribosomal protein L9 [Cuneatibacter sp. NSJ-177]
MQVVLLQDVKALGKKGDVVKVNDGYARNFILPKKLGVEATAQNLNQLKQQKAFEAKQAAEQLAEAQALGAELEKKCVKLAVKVGEGGRLFGAISSKEIVQAAKDQCGLELDKKKVVLPEPIKTLGTHLVPVKLHKDVTANLKVVVTEV